MSSRDNEFSEILILQRKDSKTTSIQYNSKMILGPESYMDDVQEQVDWDGLIWNAHIVLAVFVYHVRRRRFAVVLPPEIGPCVSTRYGNHALRA